MRRATLLDFFEDFSTLKGTFLVHDDGYRVRKVSYRELVYSSYRFADWLDEQRIGAGEKVVIWSENRPEWIAAFWGCLLAQVVVVPVDYRASEELLRRVTAIVKARAVLIGNAVKLAGDTSLPPVLNLHEVVPDEASAASVPRRTWPHPTDGSALAEIIFTSGATAEPKGVTITHRNVLANLVPIEREIAKYRKYERPFHPIRFFNLLPLSHMFGQSMATFIPPMLDGVVLFTQSYSPSEILHQIKSRRISVLVCVPKVLDVLREHLLRVVPSAAEPDPPRGMHWAMRWWKHRAVHRQFGWKFWCFVSGAAPLDPELEAFWRKLGFVVVQGYGLTETAPIVTLNHPFRPSSGTVGKPIAGVEVRIAPDGEVLVRGENVTSGYYKADTGNGAGDLTAAAFEDGWFHTGDIGEVDSGGRLLIKGRKKEMIVTAQGLNVFPEDVERALAAQPGVKEAGVVGLKLNGEERVHAVLVLEPGANVDTIVRGANETLEDHQRVWSTSIWPGETLPRTEGTQKLKRRDLQRWATAGAPTDASATSSAAAVSFEEIVGRYAAGRDLHDQTTLDELGLSSLDRVELMMALEDAFHTTLEESAVADAKTLGDLKTLIARGQIGLESHPGDVAGTTARPGMVTRDRDLGEAMTFPSYNRWRASWLLRRVSLPTWILPLARPFMQLDIKGLEHLAPLKGPVIFAANHESHMDGPAIFLSLPPRWRYNLAPAMAREFFHAHFHRREVGFLPWFTNSLNYLGATLGFNAFPLPQSGGGTRQTLRYIGEIVADGYSILIFPEGTRSPSDVISRFRPGVAMIAARLDLPVIPVRLEGLAKVLDPHWSWPKRGPVQVTFGAPIKLAGDDYIALARQVEDAVKNLRRS